MSNFGMNSLEYSLLYDIVADIGEIVGVSTGYEMKNKKLEAELERLRARSEELRRELDRYRGVVAPIPPAPLVPGYVPAPAPVLTPGPVLGLRDKKKFMEDCVKYNKEKDKLLSFGSFQHDIVNQTNKINKLAGMGGPSIRDQEDLKLERTKLGYMYYRHKFNSYVDELDKTNSCKIISEMTGGGNDGAINQLYHAYYEKKNNKKGGNRSSFDNIDIFIDEMINNKYKYTTKNAQIKTGITNDLSDVGKCLFSTVLDEERDTSKFIKYDDVHKYACFGTQMVVNEDTYEKNELYLFKKYFNVYFTDLFIKNYLTAETFELFTNYINFTIDYAIKKFISKFNEVYDPNYGNSSASDYLLSQHDIVLLYKGGNTTRMYIRNLFKKITLKNDPVSREAKTHMNTIIDGYGLGDWDYNIAVDYKNIGSKVDKFGNNITVDRMKDLLVQVVSFAISELKWSLSSLLKASYKSNDLYQLLFTRLLNRETKDKKVDEFINDLINQYNTKFPGSKYKLNSIKLKKIDTFDSEITETGIIRKDNLKTVTQSTRDIEWSGISTVYNGLPFTSNNYIEVKNIFSYNNGTRDEGLPFNEPRNNIYTMLMDDLTIVKRYTIVKFALFRLKVNNKTTMEINGRDVKLNVPFELVDISVPHENDMKTRYYDIYLNHDAYTQKYLDGYLQIKKTGMLLPISPPTADYMYADIVIMLCAEELFIWEEVKYAKRISRLFLLTLVCFVERKIPIGTIKLYFEQLQKAFTDINSIGQTGDINSGIREKLNYIITTYNPKTIDSVEYNGYLSKQLVLQSGSIVYYFDRLLEKHCEQIVTIDYIKNNTPTFKEFSDAALEIHKIVETDGTLIAPNAILGTIGYSHVIRDIDESYNKLFKFETDVLAKIEDMLVIVKGIEASGIDTAAIDLGYDKLETLY